MDRMLSDRASARRAWTTERWRPPPEVEEALAACEDVHDVRVGTILMGSILLLPVALVLDGLDVPGAWLLALIALAGIVLAILDAKWLSPRRRYRVARALFLLGDGLRRRGRSAEAVAERPADREA